MATVTSIATAIQTQLATLSDVDETSISDFLPAVDTASIAAIIVPFEQETAAVFLDVGGTYLEAMHRVRCEFWVKHVQGATSTTMQKARDIGTLAIAALMSADGTGYEINTEDTFAETVSPEFVNVGSVPFLVAVLIVPIRNEITL